MEECIFCKIIKGEIKAEKIYEDEIFLALLDVRPIKPGHLLVIPKKHSEYLFDLPNLEYSALMLKSKELAIMLKEKLNPQKIGLSVEGFGVPHAHIHLIPIDHPKEMDPNKAKESSPQELKDIAQKINSK